MRVLKEKDLRWVAGGYYDSNGVWWDDDNGQDDDWGDLWSPSDNSDLHTDANGNTVDADGTTVVVVTANSDSGGNDFGDFGDIFIYTPDFWEDAPSVESYAQDASYVAAGYDHQTPGGNHWSSTEKLSQSQVNVADKIVDYGKAHNYSNDKIVTVLTEGFFESSMGLFESNSGNPSVEGLFMYNAATWSDLGHGGLNRGSDDDQITAMYQDLDKYETRYEDGQSNGSVPGWMTFADYFELKHNEGNNYDQWSSSTATTDINGITKAGNTLGASVD